MLLLEQDIIKKERVNQSQALLKLKKFETGDSQEYKVKAIIVSAVYN